MKLEEYRASLEKQLEDAQQRLQDAVEKAIRPPILRSIELKDATFLPGHITWVSDFPPPDVRPIYDVYPELKALSDEVKQLEKLIQELEAK